MRRLLMGLVVLVVGAVCLVAGIYVAQQRMGFLGRSLEVRATVVDVQWEVQVDAGPEGGGGPIQVGFPVFRFIDVGSGEEVEALGSIGTPNPPQIGEEVDILYDPEDLDSRVVVKSFWNLWLPSLILGLFGSLFVIVGLLTVRDSRTQTGPLT